MNDRTEVNVKARECVLRLRLKPALTLLEAIQFKQVLLAKAEEVPTMNELRSEAIGLARRMGRTCKARVLPRSEQDNRAA